MVEGIGSLLLHPAGPRQHTMNRVANKFQLRYFHGCFPRTMHMYFHVGPPIRMPDTPQTQSQALLCCSLNLSVASGTSLFSERLYVAVATSRAFTRRASTFRRSSANDNNSLNGGFRQTMHGQACKGQGREQCMTKAAGGLVINFREANEIKPFHQPIRHSTSNHKESWRLWQKENCSIEEIRRMRRLSEYEVYNQILQCVQEGEDIDWFELCQEAGFTQGIALDIDRAKAGAALTPQSGQQMDDLMTVPVQCGHHVTDVHVVLYNTLMFCGITPEMLFGPTEERSVKQAQKGGAPNSMKMPGNTKTPENVMSVREAATHGPAVEERINGKASKQMSVSKSAICETDAKKAPKRLTQKHMLQWIADRDGVSLMMIVLEFKDYNECQLMRLILSLERKKQIYLRQGIFRVTLPEEGTEGQQSN